MTDVNLQTILIKARALRKAMKENLPPCTYKQLALNAINVVEDNVYKAQFVLSKNGRYEP